MLSYVSSYRMNVNSLNAFYMFRFDRLDSNLEKVIHHKDMILVFPVIHSYDLLLPIQV